MQIPIYDNRSHVICEPEAHPYWVNCINEGEKCEVTLDNFILKLRFLSYILLTNVKLDIWDVLSDTPRIISRRFEQHQLVFNRSPTDIF